eukprot:scaffold19116_cov33-Tisochrysis_lutea.AAC.2
MMIHPQPGNTHCQAKGSIHQCSGCYSYCATPANVIDKDLIGACHSQAHEAWCKGRSRAREGRSHRRGSKNAR